MFLPSARALLRSAGRAAAETRTAARPTRLTAGYPTGLIMKPAVREVRRRHPDAAMHTLHLGWRLPREALLDRRVDAVVARMPFPTDRLHVTILHDEPRVLLVPAGPRLAGKENVTLDDIAAEPTPRLPDPAWDAFWRVDPRPCGSRAPDGPPAGTVEDKLKRVAGGDAVAIEPAGSLAVHSRPGIAAIAAIPLEGVEPAHVVLASRADDRGRLVTAFRRAARTPLIGPPAPDRARAGSGRR